MPNDLVPITDEQAKAIQETAKLAGQSIEAAKAFAGYVAAVLGTAPQDLVGYLGADWLRVKRAENMERMVRKARERLDARGVKEPEPVSLSLALPLLRAGADEDREELVDVWARLLAAAMDPSRSNQVRQRFIETVQKMDPQDALVLTEAKVAEGIGMPANRDNMSSRLTMPQNDVEVSFFHLIELDCVRDVYSRPGEKTASIERIILTPYGNALLLALRD